MSSAQLESSGTTAITRGHQTLSAHLGPRVLRYLALLLAGALALAVALSGLSGLNPAGAAISSDVGDVDERLYATAPHILYDLGG